MNSEEVERAAVMLDVVRGYEDVLDTEMDYPDGDVVEDFNSACDSLERQLEKVDAELTPKDEQYVFESQEEYDEFVKETAEELVELALDGNSSDANVGLLKDEITDLAYDRSNEIPMIETIAGYDSIKLYCREGLSESDYTYYHDGPRDMLDDWSRCRLREDFRAKGHELLENQVASQ